jgi:outer membrane protein assembly factor BamB
VADGVVAAGTNAVVTALEAETGEVRWESRLDVDGGDPAVAADDGLVHYVYRDSVVTLDAGSGASRWTHSVDSDASVPVLAVDGGRVFVTAADLDLPGAFVAVRRC